MAGRQLAQAQGQLARDRALLENARRDLARYRELVRQDAASEQQRDTQAALVAQYESALQIDQAQVDHARLQLGYTRITAPISGLLGMRLVDAGKTYEQDGALWLRTTNYGDDKDRVMRKGDGSYTYFVPDVAYHITKWERGYRKAINIQGTDHHGTIARVRAATPQLVGERSPATVA